MPTPAVRRLVAGGDADAAARAGVLGLPEWVRPTASTAPLDEPAVRAGPTSAVPAAVVPPRLCVLL